VPGPASPPHPTRVPTIQRLQPEILVRLVNATAFAKTLAKSTAFAPPILASKIAFAIASTRSILVSQRLLVRLVNAPAFAKTLASTAAFAPPKLASKIANAIASTCSMLVTQRDAASSIAAAVFALMSCVFNRFWPSDFLVGKGRSYVRT
jgi:hypothetical protein